MKIFFHIFIYGIVLNSCLHARTPDPKNFYEHQNLQHLQNYNWDSRYKQNAYSYWEQRSLWYLKQNEWRKAFQSMFNALHETKDNSSNMARCYTKIGHLYFHFNKSLGDSEGYYKKALQIDPYVMDALVGTGDVYFKRGLFDQAIHYYEMAAKYHPKHPLPPASIAAAFYEKAELGKAIHYYEQSLKLNPEDITTLNNYANIWYDKGKLAEAEKHYLKAIKIDPKFVTAHNNLGNLYARTREFHKAKKHLTKALNLNDHDGGIHSNIANLYFELGFTERAKHHLRRALYYQEHPVHYNNLAVMEKFTREELTAGILYGKVLNIWPHYPSARRNSQFFRKRDHGIQESYYEGQSHAYLLEHLDRNGRATRKQRRQQKRYAR